MYSYPTKCFLLFSNKLEIVQLYFYPFVKEIKINIEGKSEKDSHHVGCFSHPIAITLSPVRPSHGHQRTGVIRVLKVNNFHHAATAKLRFIFTVMSSRSISDLSVFHERS